MRVVEVAGRPAEMGAAFGEACRAEARALYRARVANAVAQARSYGGRTIDEAWLLDAARRCLSRVQAYHPPGFEELEGVARGAGMSVEAVWAMNALTDLRDFAAYGPELVAPSPVDGEGCSSVVVPPGRSATGACLAAQTWDLATDNMPFVCVVRRRPSHGPPTVALTTAGCLTLIGLNACGVGVGTTNLRTTDVQLGVGYLDVIHAATAASDLERAVGAIRRATRMGAHYFWVVDAERGWALEGSARALVEVPVAATPHVHTNHALEPAVAALEAPNTPMASSRYRQSRLQALVQGVAKLARSDLRRFLADTDGGALAINRRDFDGISTNGAVVMDPAAGVLDVAHGPPAADRWQTVSVD